MDKAMTEFLPPLRRRRMIQGLSAGGVLGLAAGRAQAADADVQTLRLGTWGGSWRDSLDATIGKPLAASGVKVDYVLGSPASNLAKLIAARGRESPLDAMEGAPDIAASMVAAKLIDRLDYSQLPNAKGLLPFAHGDYQVITVATLDGVVYNTAKFAELGIPAPARYRDLINPKLAGRVAFPDINHTQHWNAVVGLAYDAGGDETTITKAIPLVNQIRPAVFYESSTDLATRFGAGDIWAAPWHAGFVVRLKRTGLPVAMTHPTIGNRHGALWPVLFHQVAGAKAPAAAAKFLDTYLSPAVQFEHSKVTGSLPMNADARERLKTDPENRDVLMFSDAELNGALLVDFSRIDLPAWREAWSRDILRS
jgi:putative spermidine/putrescine transport system substrate-binding protein